MAPSTFSWKLLAFLTFGIVMVVLHQGVLVARYHADHRQQQQQQHLHDANAALYAMLASWSLSSMENATTTSTMTTMVAAAARVNNNTVSNPMEKAAAAVAQHTQSSSLLLPKHPQPAVQQPLQSRSNLVVDRDDIFQFDWKKYPPFAIFYNVYIPKEETSSSSNHNKKNTVTTTTAITKQADDEENRRANSKRQRRVRRIFQEQMKTVGSSYANSIRGSSPHGSSHHKPVTVYYNTIGDATALNASFVHSVCTEQYNFTCRHLQHYDAAFEDVTLQRLYEFCHVVHPPVHDDDDTRDDDEQTENKKESHDLRVVYMHNKGSFNKARYQNDNRRIFTQTVTSRACLQPSHQQHHQDCNVCGHLFQPVWGPFFGGNFWVASCSYIRQLIPPKLINQTMTEQLIPALNKMQQQGQLLTNLLPVVGPYALGTGRYSHEHWVAGHGTIRPCDIVVEKEQGGQNAMTVAGTLTTTTTTQHSMLAPREPINSTKWYGFKPTWTARVMQNQQLRLREYFLLPGHLFRLHVLYPQQGPPPSDSWIWHWYPDGNLWKDAMEKYGGILRAIDAVTSRYRENATKTTSRE